MILATALAASAAGPAFAQARSNVAAVQLTVTKPPGALAPDARRLLVNTPFSLQVRTPLGTRRLLTRPAGELPLDSLARLLATAGRGDSAGPLVVELMLEVKP